MYLASYLGTACIFLFDIFDIIYFFSFFGLVFIRLCAFYFKKFIYARLVGFFLHSWLASDSSKDVSCLKSREMDLSERA